MTKKTLSLPVWCLPSFLVIISCYSQIIVICCHKCIRACLKVSILFLFPHFCFYKWLFFIFISLKQFLSDCVTQTSQQISALKTTSHFCSYKKITATFELMVFWSRMDQSAKMVCCFVLLTFSSQIKAFSYVKRLINTISSKNIMAPCF